MRELLAAPADIGRAAPDFDLGGRFDECAGLVDAATIHENLPGEDATDGALAAGEEGLFYEEFVEAYSRCHVTHYRRRVARGRNRKSNITPATKPPMWANQATPPPFPFAAAP